MTDFFQIAHGDGSQGPPTTNFRPWKNTGREDRETMRRLALNQFLRNSGHLSQPEIKALKVTVWHYRSGDPLHANGRPMTVTATTYEINR